MTLCGSRAGWMNPKANALREDANTLFGSHPDTACFLHLKQADKCSSVPQRSPFRYPGGKTWLVPYIRDWFRSKKAARPPD